MLQLEDLRLVCALSRSPSLSAAARSLNVTPPALSMRLKKLEQLFGVALAVRTAHRLSLTAEGEQLAVQGLDLLSRLDALPELLKGEGSGLSGPLRISAPFGFGRRHVAPLVARFAAAHPGIRISLDLLEAPWPDRRDVDVVVHIGAVRDSSWVAHTLAANERWLCASPGYLKGWAPPLRQPRDVLDHACLCIRENDEDVTLWHYRKRGTPKARPGGLESLRIVPAMTSNDGDVARQWAEQGLGLVLRSQWDAAVAVAEGRLVRLLPDWLFGDAPVLALVPTRKGRAVRVRAFVEFLQAGFAPRPPW